MYVIFSRKQKRLMFISESLMEGTGTIASFKAANNADSRSKGEWPAGVYLVDTVVDVDDPDGSEGGAYGRWFIRFKPFTQEDGQERTGMGIHAGRKHKTDLAGRAGIEYATKGCIRTTSEAMDYVTKQWSNDPVKKLWIVD